MSEQGLGPLSEGEQSTPKITRRTFYELARRNALPLTPEELANFEALAEDWYYEIARSRTNKHLKMSAWREQQRLLATIRVAQEQRDNYRLAVGNLATDGVQQADEIERLQAELKQVRAERDRYKAVVDAASVVMSHYETTTGGRVEIHNFDARNLWHALKMLGPGALSTAQAPDNHNKADRRLIGYPETGKSGADTPRPKTRRAAKASPALKRALDILLKDEGHQPTEGQEPGKEG